MVALYTVWYNYVKQHKSLKGLSPAMLAGISSTLWSMTDLAEMIDVSLPKPGPRGPYEKRMVVCENIIRDSKAASYRSSMVRLLAFGAK